MIYFLKMPTGSILIDHSLDWHNSISEIRKEYHPLFIAKVAEMFGGQKEVDKLRGKFSHIKLPGGIQFKPSPALVELINDQVLFSKLEYNEQWETVRLSRPPSPEDQIEIYIPKDLEESLLTEGAYIGESPTEIIREVLSIFMSARLFARQDNTHMKKLQIDRMISYINTF